MKAIIISASIMASLVFTTADKLTGKWESVRSEKGNVTGVVFKPDNRFEGYVNRKPFVSGEYSFQDGVFSFTDNGCEGKRGEYRIIFFSNDDSIRFVPVNDSCSQRKEGMSRLVLGRVK